MRRSAATRGALYPRRRCRLRCPDRDSPIGPTHRRRVHDGETRARSNFPSAAQAHRALASQRPVAPRCSCRAPCLRSLGPVPRKIRAKQINSGRDVRDIGRVPVARNDDVVSRIRKLLRERKAGTGRRQGRESQVLKVPLKTSRSSISRPWSCTVRTTRSCPSRIRRRTGILYAIANSRGGCAPNVGRRRVQPGVALMR
jgi:hypothetical protein